jgi:hypothetical protein
MTSSSHPYSRLKPRLGYLSLTATCVSRCVTVQPSREFTREQS